MLEIVPVSIPSEPLPVVPAPAEELGLYNFNNLYNSGNATPAPEASVPAKELELYNFNNSCNSSNTVPDPVPISISMGDIQIEIGASAPNALITKIIGALRNA